jgi:hypothetical protein
LQIIFKIFACEVDYLQYCTVVLNLTNIKSKSMVTIKVPEVIYPELAKLHDAYCGEIERATAEFDAVASTINPASLQSLPAGSAPHERRFLEAASAAIRDFLNGKRALEAKYGIVGQSANGPQACAL